MDENTNKRIEELKNVPHNRLLPILFVPLALVIVFCYRVGTTEPSSAGVPPTADVGREGASRTPSAPATSVSTPEPVVESVKPIEEKPTSETPVAQAPSVVETPSAETKPEPKTTKPEPEPETPAAVVSELDAYLERNLGKQVPFLYKGEKRKVVLAAFTDDTVTIKRKKSFTMKRSELSPEQLELWK